MRKSLVLAALAVVSLVAVSPLAYGRGGGGGGGRGGGPGGGRGGFGGGGRTGGVGGFFGSGGRMGTGTGQGMGANRFSGNRGNQSDSELQELEDRKALIAERRGRLADNDRAANQEARLAAERLAATGEAAGIATF